MPISRSNKPNIVITKGDPSGIGPEVTEKALASPMVKGLANFLVIGGGRSVEYGVSRPEFGRSARQYIDTALELLKAGKADALVTAPVNKASIRSSGLKDFEGHTEYLAARTGTKDFAMMFVGERLKITLVTRHIALKDVPRKLSCQAIYRTILLTDAGLKKYFKISSPRIGVAGLNPHAGECGAFGKEEETIIAPAVKKAAGKVKDIKGPIPPDVIFNDCLNGRFDAVVSMYHDQALIPFKLLYFKDGVNLTLGLPFVRTSPDHGTAFDIAGKGIADPSSMIAAIKLACKLSRV